MPIHGLHKLDILAYAPSISNKRCAELILFCRMSPDCTHANTANIMMRLRDRKSPQTQGRLIPVSNTRPTCQFVLIEGLPCSVPDEVPAWLVVRAVQYRRISPTK
jgi:hypothetical protein